ncbi:MAG: arginine--tRNA ligase [Deltaproteobacteria bacterium]
MSVRKITESMVLSGIRRKLDQWGIREKVPQSIEIPKQPEHGDFSTNAALQAARLLGRPPREVAGEILEAIREEDRRGWFRSLSVAGPGFINLVLSDEAWREGLAEVLREGSRFGGSRPETPERVLLEFVSANPTGPLHVGHGRGAAVGDALVRILRFAGYEVDSEYYVNDVGNQMEKLGASLHARYLQRCGVPAPLPEDGYRGEYLVRLAEEIFGEIGDRYRSTPPEEALPWFREEACNRILQGIREDLEIFRVRFDRWFREETLHRQGIVSDSIGELTRRGQTYRSEDAVYFRSGSLGDEKDRVLVRADGRTTYFAADLAYHRDKLKRGYDRCIDIWGADHHGYAPRLSAALKGIGEDERRLEILLVQFVTLIREGKAVQMSTRSGEFTTLREVIEEVGTDAARFFYLLRSASSHLDFDLTLAKTRSRENPVYYIQYVHARICSLFREAGSRGIHLEKDPSLASLDHPDELHLMKEVAKFPEVVSAAAGQREPHRIPFYLLDLAREFHAFYHHHRFLDERPGKMQARMALAAAVRQVVATGLSLIGVSAPEAM